jgi:hypothetical protein
VFVTLVVLLSRGREADAEAVEATSSVQRILDDFSAIPGGRSEDVLTVQDFILPEGIGNDTAEPYLLRSPLRRWSEEQVNRYWIPLKEIALDLVRRENDRRIEGLFEGIP